MGRAVTERHALSQGLRMVVQGLRAALPMLQLLHQPHGHGQVLQERAGMAVSGQGWAGSQVSVSHLQGMGHPEGAGWSPAARA